MLIFFQNPPPHGGPLSKLTCPLKRDHSKKKIHLQSIHSQGDMLVLRGVQDLEIPRFFFGFLSDVFFSNQQWITRCFCGIWVGYWGFKTCWASRPVFEVFGYETHGILTFPRQTSHLKYAFSFFLNPASFFSVEKTSFFSHVLTISSFWASRKSQAPLFMFPLILMDLAL